MKKTVTIIIPCQNEIKYIARCLDSLIKNDYPNLTVISHEFNKGIGKAFETGFKNINTDYVKNILLEHDAIKSVSIKVTKDRDWGETIEADLILNTKEFNSDDIKEWCRSNMPQYSIPKTIRIVTK